MSLQKFGYVKAMPQPTQEDKEFLQYKKLCYAIVIQAMKDYYEAVRIVRGEIHIPKSPIMMIEVKEWVEDMSGTFELCALAMDKPMKKLQKMMFEKMEDMDLGGELKI